MYPRFSCWFIGNSRDHPCGNFLVISLRKFRGNGGEFSMWIFLPPFPAESLAIFPCWNFPHVFLKKFKMEYNDLGRVPVMWEFPSDDLMTFFGELKCLKVWGNFLLTSTPIRKFPLNFCVDSHFTWNPNFRVDSLHHQPPSLGILRRIREILPVGNHWKNLCMGTMFKPSICNGMNMVTKNRFFICHFSMVLAISDEGAIIAHLYADPSTSTHIYTTVFELSVSVWSSNLWCSPVLTFTISILGRLFPNSWFHIALNQIKLSRNSALMMKITIITQVWNITWVS